MHILWLSLAQRRGRCAKGALGRPQAARYARAWLGVWCSSVAFQYFPLFSAAHSEAGWAGTAEGGAVMQLPCLVHQDRGVVRADSGVHSPDVPAERCAAPTVVLLHSRLQTPLCRFLAPPHWRAGGRNT